MPTPAMASVESGVWVDDVHAGLSATRVERVFRPKSVAELAAVVGNARGSGAKLCVAGARHAMGGQPFASGGWLIDTSELASVGALDERAGLLEVEAGARWPELLSALIGRQGDRAGIWTIAQKQTGADRLSLGGAVGSNVHGRGLRMAPFVADLESLELVDVRGELRHCSRSENRELFALVVGGYGLFGVVASLRLRLTRRRKLVRRVETARVEEAVARLEHAAAEGALYGDFQFAIDAGSAAFLRDGVLSCYHPADDGAPFGTRRRSLSEADWRRLIRLAHFEPSRGFELYVEHYLATDGQVYWSDLHQLGTYVDGYHEEIDRASAAAEAGRGSEMIGELFVPRRSLPEFFDRARRALRRDRAQVIYGTVRLIERDPDSFLAWAREPWACSVFNLHTPHTPAGLERSARAFRGLIEAARALGGSYYLTYHRWANREQLESCHPRLREFLRRKRELDPDELFTSEWHRHLAGALGSD